MAANQEKNGHHKSPHAKITTIPKEVRTQLYARFLQGLPEQENSSVIRLSFRIEQMHWFYTDHVKTQRTDCSNVTLKDFFRIVFHDAPHPMLKQCADDVDQIYCAFNSYKQKVPTFGGLILDEAAERVLLVQSFYGGWLFPKGKVNKSEPMTKCAAREVWEEAGVKIESLIDEEVFLELQSKCHYTRLYIVVGVKEGSEEGPQVPGEIKAVRWFSIRSLFNADRNATRGGLGKENFYAIQPFLQPLVNWLAKKRSEDGGKVALPQKTRTSPIAAESTAARRSTSESDATQHGDETLNKLRALVSPSRFAKKKGAPSSDGKRTPVRNVTGTNSPVVNSGDLTRTPVRPTAISSNAAQQPKATTDVPHGFFLGQRIDFMPRLVDDIRELAKSDS